MSWYGPDRRREGNVQYGSESVNARLVAERDVKKWCDGAKFLR